MSYDYLTTDWNNGDHVNGGHGVLDVSTGVFTAGLANLSKPLGARNSTSIKKSPRKLDASEIDMYSD